MQPGTLKQAAAMEYILTLIFYSVTKLPVVSITTSCSSKGSMVPEVPWFQRFHGSRGRLYKTLMQQF